MYCSKCGTELEKDQTICPVCNEDTPKCEDIVINPGSSEKPDFVALGVIREDKPEEAEENPAQELPEEEEEAPNKPKKKTGKLILAILACGVLLSALIFLVLYGMGIRFTTDAKDVLTKENYCVAEEESVEYADKVVATLGDYKLTNAQLQIFYWSSVYNYINNNSAYLSYIGLDIETPLSEQISYEDKTMTWQQYFLENALQVWATYARLCMVAKQEDYSLQEEVKTNLESIGEDLEQMAAENGHENADAMLDVAMGKASTPEAYAEYMNLCILGDSYYGEKSLQFEPTENEIEAYFVANEQALAETGITKESGKLANVRHILLQPAASGTDEAGKAVSTEQDWADCRQKAEELLNQWLNNNPTEESFAQLAVEHSVDGGSAANGGLYTNVYAGQMVEAFDAWVMDESRIPGDYGIVRTKFGDHIMLYLSDEALWHYNVKVTVYNERAAAFNEMMEENWPAKYFYKRIVLSKDVV